MSLYEKDLPGGKALVDTYGGKYLVGLLRVCPLGDIPRVTDGRAEQRLVALAQFGHR